MSSSNRLVVAILAVAVLAIGFWMLALGPKREKADELSSQVEALNVTLTQAQSDVAVAEAARRDFPSDYRQLVVLGEAVPEGDETSSLLVELDKIAGKANVDFEGIQLTSGSGGEAPAPAAVPATPPAEAAPAETSGAVPAAATVPPTEAAVSLLPLGATTGPAGLAVMPYTLTFSGDFFEIADFIKGVNSLVHTSDSKVGVDGRLMTIDGFALNTDAAEGGEAEGLGASFMVTTFVTPPTQGITAGASPSAPAPSLTSESGSEEAPESSAGAAQ